MGIHGCTRDSEGSDVFETEGYCVFETEVHCVLETEGLYVLENEGPCVLHRESLYSSNSDAGSDLHEITGRSELEESVLDSLHAQTRN